VKLVLEQDDHATRAAVSQLRLGAPFQVIVAPDIGPRTKPKALNIALAFARGEFTAVYDAEDRPEPDQLRRAVAAFNADPRLACVQARLTIDNTEDGWLARLFTAEYAGLFDVLLPAIAARGLPLPLGGSSNHFRTADLRAVGGWDAHNVTEDADLGMRLARFGYRTGVIDSTTYEEAPARLVPWLKQRTRWFKGWMQTWLVHMREPRRLYRELGFAGFAAFQLLVGGNVLAALVHPLFAALVAVSLIADGLHGLRALGTLYGTIFVAGYAASAAIGAVGLHRRGLLSSAPWLALMPLHWLLLSAAAWRGLHQLVSDPQRWEKTEHGHARTSRGAAAIGSLTVGVRYTAAGRRPLPRAAAPG
jgi:glycosyltransferase XagB